MSPVDFPVGRRVATNGIELVVHDGGEGPAVVLLHGFPELAYSWRHQVPALIAAGCRVIAPDQRGYAHSDAPEDHRDYSMRTLVADVIGLLDSLDIPEATVVGHDFGGMVAWHCAVYAPSVSRRLRASALPTVHAAAPTSPSRTDAGSVPRTT